jgi:glyoxylase-like metal-dependent hydrolase (beta-lactamase superfamily II)
MKCSFVYFLSFLFMACQATKGIHRAQQLLRAGNLKTAATTVESPRCCTNDSVRIQFIGCGGYLIRRGDDAVLIDPYFSNAPLGFGKLKTDSALVASFFYQNFKNSRDFAQKMPKSAFYTEGSPSGNNLDSTDQNVIKTILISHAHHDHLADLPYVFQHHLSAPNNTVLLGSETASNILRAFQTPFDPAQSFFNLDSIFRKKHLSNDTMPVRWMSQNRHLRITAVEAEHAPHFGGVKIPGIGGNVLSVPKRAARTTFGFKEGRNYNYLIDFLSDKGGILFRIYAAGGAASRPTVGFLDPSVFLEKKVDFLILCGANFDQAVHYPEALMQHIQPEQVLIGHWEDFFTPIPTLLKKPQTVRLTNIPLFVKKIKAEMLKNGNHIEPILLQPLTPLTVRF